MKKEEAQAESDLCVLVQICAKEIMPKECTRKIMKQAVSRSALDHQRRMCKIRIKINNVQIWDQDQECAKIGF